MEFSAGLTVPTCAVRGRGARHHQEARREVRSAASARSCSTTRTLRRRFSRRRSDCQPPAKLQEVRREAADLARRARGPERHDRHVNGEVRGASGSSVVRPTNERRHSGPQQGALTERLEMRWSNHSPLCESCAPPRPRAPPRPPASEKAPSASTSFAADARGRSILELGAALVDAAVERGAAGAVERRRHATLRYPPADLSASRAAGRSVHQRRRGHRQESIGRAPRTLGRRREGVGHQPFCVFGRQRRPPRARRGTRPASANCAWAVLGADAGDHFLLRV